MNDLIIILFLLIPLATFTHEVGHCICVKLLKGNINSIVIGTGTKLFSIGKLCINKIYFYSGMFTYSNINKNSRMKKIFILLGGVILNFIMFITVAVLSIAFEGSIKHYLLLFSQVNLYFGVFNLLPLTIGNMNLDGKQIYQVIRYGDSQLFR